MIEIVTDVLNTAKEDEQLAELLSQWSEAIPEAGDLNEQMQNAIEGLLADVEDADTSQEETDGTADNSYLSSKIWINDEDQIEGRQFTLCQEDGTETSFTWQKPENGADSALLVDVQSDDGNVTIQGSGQTTDGKKTGTYVLYSEGAAVLNIDLSDYDVEAAKAGYPAGTYTITVPQGESEEDYNALGAFSLVVGLTSNQSDDSLDLSVDLLSSGVSLGTLSMHIAKTEETLEAVSEEDMGTIYDAENEEDMAAFAQELNFDTVLENAKNAGVPEELLSVLEQTIESALSSQTEAETDVDTAMDVD
jgi:hypothetical protein